MKNPFQFGRELGVGDLVDRQEEVREVEQALREGNKLFLVGPRRFGKTSILKTAADRLAAESGIVLRLDVESFSSINELAAQIVSRSAKFMGSDVRSVVEQVRKVFGRIRPEMDWNGVTGEWSVKLGLDSEKLADPVLIVDALNGFEKLAKAQPDSRPVGLILDEFQRVIEFGGRTLEGQIRAAIQTHARTGYVFAGSKTRMLHDMVMDKTRPFYRLGKNIFLKSVPRPDFERFLTRSFVTSGMTAEGAAVRLILDLAEDVPFNIQQLAHQCWVDLKTSGRPGKPTLSEVQVRASLETLVRQQDPFYAQIWNGLTTIQQRTLRSVTEEKGVLMQSTRVVRSIGYLAPTVRKALLAMASMTILREEQTGNHKLYRFEDPFFASWIRLTVGH